MTTRTTCWGIAALTLFVAGCSRQDTDGLTRVGRKLSARADVIVQSVQDYLNVDFGLGAGSLENRVANRLRWDKNLADIAIEVKARGGEIELKGTLADAALKTRAVEIAESTAGVEKVTDNLQVLDLTPVPAPPKDNTPAPVPPAAPKDVAPVPPPLPSPPDLLPIPPPP